MANILKKFYMGLKSMFPSHEPGAVLYSTDENGLYIDSKTKRNRINPPSDWEEIDQNSPSYIANKPQIDDTLTVSGAVADAKATGDEIQRKASTDSIADEFTTSSAYAIGDLVIYESKLYKFKTAHAVGAWNSAQVDAVNLVDELAEIKTKLNEIWAAWSTK